VVRAAFLGGPGSFTLFDARQAYSLMCEQTHALYRGLARGEGG
jgi:hypothetical protein